MAAGPFARRTCWTSCVVATAVAFLCLPPCSSTRPRLAGPRRVTHTEAMPSARGGKGKGQAGMDLVVAAAAELAKIVDEIPANFLPQFEEAALAVIRDAQEGRGEEEGVQPASSDSRETKRRKKADKVDPFQQMEEIKHWLRLKMPADAVLPSEQIVFGHVGTDFADFTASNTQSVDGFLYDEDDVDELCEQGKLARSYCTACGCRDVKDLNFISHSLSLRELHFIFTQALPRARQLRGMRDMTEGCVVDVGSRLGVVLYAACVFANAKEAVGIEINPELCKVQAETIKVFGLDGSARVVCGDVRNELALIASAHVVVLHNVFQFFMSKTEAADAWNKLIGALPVDTLVVTCPAIEEQLATSCEVQAGRALFKRFDPVDIEYPAAEDGNDEYADKDGLLFSNIRLYTVCARK